MCNRETLKRALREIFSGIEQLRQAFPDKKFTIDGRLVGDIGEAIAQWYYDITLYQQNIKRYDGETEDGRRVQIKATFKESLTFSLIPDYYLGLKIFRDGTYKEIFNGPGKFIQRKYGHRKGFGEKLLSFPISVLSELSASVPDREKIPKRS